MNQNLLRIQNLRTYFYTSKGIVKAVDDVDLKIKYKEIVGLVGESGCGKSTIALSVMGLVPNPGRIIEGDILFKDKNLINLTNNEMKKIRGKEISMIFQDPLTYLNPVMKVGDQISEAIKKHQTRDKKEIRETMIKSLEMVNIFSPEDVSKFYAHELSGGMRQRILMAIALSCNPNLLIADEPTTSLDVTIQMQILDLLKELKNKFKKSFLLITHDLGIISEICDHVYVMYAGKIIENADVFTLFDNPMHPYTRGLLNSVLSIHKFKNELISIEGNVPNPIQPPFGCRFHPRCQRTMEICKKETPPYRKEKKGHIVACWLYS